MTELCNQNNFKNLLDIGAGKDQPHTKYFNENGIVCDTVDFFDNSTFKGNYNNIDIDKQYDVVWCSHVLEHQRNVGSFLDKIKNNTRNGGLIAITVPPLKHKIVSGHVNLWNAGLLVYNLVLTGLNCRDIKIKTHKYNISVLLYKKEIQLPELNHDFGDLIILNEFLPEFSIIGEDNAFDGKITEWNWK